MEIFSISSAGTAPAAIYLRNTRRSQGDHAPQAAGLTNPRGQEARLAQKVGPGVGTCVSGWSAALVRIRSRTGGACGEHESRSSDWYGQSAARPAWPVMPRAVRFPVRARLDVGGPGLVISGHRSRIQAL